MKCCLVIGHTKDSPGAVNLDSGITEFEFNENLAAMIMAGACEVTVVYRGRPDDYGGLPAKVNAERPDFIIELHANAFNTQASGTEMLYWHSSVKGKRLSGILQEEIAQVLGLSDRGIKAVQAGGRGAHLLQKTNAPCVLAEPFFIDNIHDLARATTQVEELANAYVRAIKEYAKPVRIAA